MRRLITILFAVVFLFCGCSEQEKVVQYDLAICDVSMDEMCDYLSGFENENYRIQMTEFSVQNLETVVNELKSNSDGLNSITLYSKNITDETAQLFIDFVKTKELPVTFAFSNISTEVLKNYDKAFCITTNYTHAAEMTAEAIKQLWADGTIIDADKNQIFTFATVKEEELSPDMQAYYDTLIAGIELYGVPMQVNSDISPDDVVSGESLTELNKNNESLIIVDKSAAAYINQYTPYSSGTELIAFTENCSNILAENSFTLHCFVDQTQYKLAADEIVQNFNNRQYPLIDISFPVIERTIYIPATI